jgi:hypothetical protein
MMQIAVVLGALALLVAATAAVVHRNGGPPVGLVPSLLALSGVLMAGVSVVAAEAAEAHGAQQLHTTTIT